MGELVSFGSMWSVVSVTLWVVMLCWHIVCACARVCVCVCVCLCVCVYACILVASCWYFLFRSQVISEFVGVVIAVVDRTISGEAPEVLLSTRSMHT